MQNLALIGFVVDDSKLIDGIENKQFLSFQLACTRKKKGEQITQWYNCAMSQVKLLDYIKMGKKLYISGTPEYSLYTDKDNNIQVSMNLSVQKVDFLKRVMPL